MFNNNEHLYSEPVIILTSSPQQTHIIFIIVILSIPTHRLFNVEREDGGAEVVDLAIFFIISPPSFPRPVGGSPS